MNIRQKFREVAPKPVYAAAVPIYRLLTRFHPKFGLFNPDRYIADIVSPKCVFDQPSEVLTPAGRVWPETPDSDYQRDDDLHKLALEFKPSKRQQGYIRHYSKHFASIRDDVKLMIEIGVQTPTSILMWERYFPNATIVGVDIDPACKAFEGGRKQIRIGDQNDNAFLDSIVDEFGGNIDIVIDDGEHSMPAILTSFCKLFPALKSHGIYVVEDLVAMPRIMPFFYQIERSINYWPNDGSEWPYLWQFQNASWLDRNVTGLHFYRHICFVERGHNPEDNPYLVPKP